MNTSITEGHWTYQRGEGVWATWTATDSRTGETLTAVDIVDARRRTFEFDRARPATVRYSIAGGPGRAISARRYTQRFIEAA